MLNSAEEIERAIRRAARNYQQTDHYDYSLFGLDVHLDRAVAQHQREAMLYNQGECVGFASEPLVDVVAGKRRLF